MSNTLPESGTVERGSFIMPTSVSMYQKSERFRNLFIVAMKCFRTLFCKKSGKKNEQCSKDEQPPGGPAKRDRIVSV